MPNMRHWSALDEGSGFKLKFGTVVRHGGTLDGDPDGFFLRILFLFLNGGRVLADRFPPLL